MESKELMIGDWVYSSFADVPCKVISIDTIINGFTSVQVSNVAWKKDIVSLSPIPLTPEILEKNGFEINRGFASSERHLRYSWEYYNRKEGDYGFIDVIFYEKPFKIRRVVKIENKSSKGLGFNSVQNCDIDYVHQLQHAIRLCGIKKEIIVP